MKIRTLFLALTVVLCFAFLGQALAQVPTISASVNKSSGYNPGESGVITIKFNTANNIKIPVEPEISVSLSGDGVSGTGMQTPSTSGDYLSPEKIKYNFVVSSSATSGSKLKIKVSVKFGYCNSETGVCKIATKTAWVTVKVK